MKDNLNIEELFKEKFSSFEGDVSPDAWANIQQGMNAANATSAAAAKTGLSTLMKTVLVSGGIIAATVTGVYLWPDEQPNTTGATDTIVQNDSETESVDLPQENADIIQVMDENDPVIEEQRAEIEEEIRADEQRIEEDNTDNSVIVSENPTNGGTVNNEVVSETGNANGSNDQVTAGGSDNLEVNEPVVNENDEPEITEEIEYPSGNMGIIPGDEYAPSTYKFNANAKNFESVRWEFGDGNFGVGESVEHTYEKPGNYQVKMTVIGNGELYEESQTVTINSKSSIDNIPNVITPNGDRINDFFAINTTEIETFFIAIRDAQGNVVFESKDAAFRWDGSDRSGTILEKGRYTYMIFATGYDGSEFKIPGQIYIK